VLNSYSRGTVQLSNGGQPDIRYNFLEDRRDADRLATGLALALELLDDRHVRPLVHETFLPDGALIASLNARTNWNRVRSLAIESVLEIPVLRRALFASTRIDRAQLGKNDAALRDFVQRSAGMHFHVCGTCRMGRASDADAVVDSSGKVFGVEGLRVADASIFPSVPRGYIHLTVIMAGEKIADAVKAELNGARPALVYEPKQRAVASDPVSGHAG
jgi:5-(hydroxymethyl)furfural/furfural oxidase